MNDIELKQIKESYLKRSEVVKQRIVVCGGTGCLAIGALKVYDRLVEEIKARDLDLIVSMDFDEKEHSHGDGAIHVSESGCQGLCQLGPLVTIKPENIFYTKVGVDDVAEIVEKTIINKEIIKKLLYKNPADKKKCETIDEIPFYNMQTRLLLEPCGSLDAEDIKEYISIDGYAAALKSYTQMTSEEICQVVMDSGLRGRGGGGFPAGRKWALALKQDSEKKYILCNGDEGDPGAFMDGSILVGNPHSVVEGMMIAAKGMGADEGLVYVRTEYPLAVKRIKKAIKDARAMGLLGENIFGSGHNFDIRVMEGAGAFVCGEASAMVESITGNRGIPRPKPPRTAEKGLHLKPTIVNNVETLSSVPFILFHGADEYRKYGTEGSSGTKTFALTGHVANTGLIEVPFGTTLREIIFEISGGVVNQSGKIDNSSFKAVQTGGPSGGCLPEKHLDIPLSFDSLKRIGSMIGSGGMVVMNQDTCMVQVARFFIHFTQEESCGKCTPCREGTKQMLGMLDEIIEGKGTLKSIDDLETLGRAVMDASLCGLGKSAPSPILSTIKEFREEYESHVVDKFCPTGKCANLFDFWIDPDLCKGCTLCAKACPTDAISGEKKEPHQIAQENCTKCGSCRSTCKFNAIEVVKVGSHG